MYSTTVADSVAMQSPALYYLCPLFCPSATLLRLHALLQLVDARRLNYFKRFKTCRHYAFEH